MNQSRRMLWQCCEKFTIFLFEHNNLPTLSLFLSWLCDFVYLKFAQISAYRNQNQRGYKKCIWLGVFCIFLVSSICQWPVLLSLLTTQIGLSVFLFPHGHMLMKYVFPTLCIQCFSYIVLYSANLLWTFTVL